MREGGSYSKDPIPFELTLIERTVNDPVATIEPVPDTAPEVPTEPADPKAETNLAGKNRKMRE